MTTNLKLAILLTFLICTIGGGHGGGPIGFLEFIILLDLGSLLQSKEFILLGGSIMTVVAQLIGLLGILNKFKDSDRFSVLSTVLLIVIAIPLFVLSVQEITAIAIFTFTPLFACAVIGLVKYFNKKLAD